MEPCPVARFSRRHDTRENRLEFLRPTANFVFPGSKGSGEQKQPQKSAIRLKQSPCLLINVYLHDNKHKTVRPQRPSFFQGDGVFHIQDFPGSFFLFGFQWPVSPSSCVDCLKCVVSCTVTR